MKLSNSNFGRESLNWLKEKGKKLNNKLLAWWAKQSKTGLFLKSLAFCVVGGILSLAIFCLAVQQGAFGKLPTYAELKDIQHNTASEVYSADGVLLGKYYIENRINADFGEISPHIINALIATEDARFFEHGGVDIRAALRVIFKSILLQDESSGGGSTLSQQLAKNLYPRQAHSFLTMPVNKVKEMLLARRLEKLYTKEELLNLYLNTVTFSENIFGVKVAANRFFRTSPQKVKVEEAAVLVGMLKATYSYNPLKNYERSLQRRNVVLSQMEKYDYLSKAELDSLQQLPIDLKYYQEGNNLGLATYFREYLRLDLEEKLKAYQKPNGETYNLYTDGLKIYTTIHSKMQQYAESAVAERMARLQQDFDKHWKSKKPWRDDRILQAHVEQSKRYQHLKKKGLSEEEIKTIFDIPVKMTIFAWLDKDKKKVAGEIEKEMSPLDSVKYYLSLLNAGFMVMEPHNGHIKAWVGGIHHKYFKYDHVKSKRQVGSTFKPIVYAKALESNIYPCDYTENNLVTYTEHEDWKPENADGQYGGLYSMAGGLSQSVNCVTVDLMMRTGVDSVRALASRMGIKSEIPAVPSIALGTAAVSLMDMLNVYGTFANRGLRPEPYYITKIETATGKVVAEFESPQYKTLPRVLSQEHGDMMIELLQTVVDSGTARRLRYDYGLYNEIAGKTGTTQNQSDGWFIGFTPNLVAGAWVGAELPIVHFRSLRQGQGANTALPIWAIFMQKMYRDKAFKPWKRYQFQSPMDSLIAMMDCPLYLEEWETIEEDPEDEEFFDAMISVFKKDNRNNPRRSNGGLSPHSQNIRKRNEALKRKRERKAKRKKFWDKVLGRN